MMLRSQEALERRKDQVDATASCPRAAAATAVNPPPALLNWPPCSPVSIGWLLLCAAALRRASSPALPKLCARAATHRLGSSSTSWRLSRRRGSFSLQTREAVKRSREEPAAHPRVPWADKFAGVTSAIAVASERQRGGRGTRVLGGGFVNKC